jgi:hypothetical protein
MAMHYDSGSMDYSKVRELIGDVERFRSQFKRIDYVHDRGNFLELCEELWDFVVSYQDEETMDLFFRSEYYHYNKTFFNLIELYHERTREATEALKILTGESPSSEDYFIASSFSPLVYEQKAYSMLADVLTKVNSGCNKLVFVGSGPLPTTIFYIHDNTDIPNIVGLDNNQESVYIAGEIVQSQNLKRINLVFHDGVDYDYSDTDIVLIANMVSGKDRVIDRIAQTGKKDVVVISREPVRLSTLFYERIKQGFDSRFMTIGVMEPDPGFPSRMTIMRKFDFD